MLNRFQEYLNQQDRILLTTHENPDGDGTGAMLGLAHYLRSLGKTVRIVVSPALPGFLSFMDTEGWVEAFDPQGRTGIWPPGPAPGSWWTPPNPTGWAPCTPCSRPPRPPGSAWTTT